MTEKATKSLCRSRYLNFSNEEDEKLIALVESHRALYDICEKDHRDLVVRNNLWVDVAKKMKRSVIDCKKRWRSMKDTFYRHKRTKMRSNWILFNKLEFLDTAGRNFEGFNEESSEKTDEIPGISGKDDEFDNNAAELKNSTFADVADEFVPYDSDMASESKMQSEDFGKFVPKINREDVENDPIFLFFHSMALSVKNLPLELIVEARVKICEIVGELEVRAMKNQEKQEFSNIVKEEIVDEDFDTI